MAQMTCFAKVRASGQDKRLAHALPFREGTTQNREPLRQSGLGPPHSPITDSSLPRLD